MQKCQIGEQDERYVQKKQRSEAVQRYFPRMAPVFFSYNVAFGYSRKFFYRLARSCFGDVYFKA